VDLGASGLFGLSWLFFYEVEEKTIMFQSERLRPAEEKYFKGFERDI